ncbi:MAG: SDR family NAD(P)-dependent oxidoreductase [Gammaproteobacteria bacterium]
MKLAGRTAVVTGAGGGIGRALAIALAKRRCNLALADIDEAGLEQTRGLVEGHAAGSHAAGSQAVNVSLHILDVADQKAVAAFPAAVAQHHAKVDLLVNNAGVALGGYFEEISEADFQWLFNINFWGVVWMTRAFLPLLRQSDDAGIVTMSSLFGLISPPGQTAYSASKFAVRGFCNALRYELQDSTVALTVVHPGGVATSIAKNSRKPKDRSAAQIAESVARIEKLLRMPPQRAAEIIIDGVAKGKARILVGADAKAISLLERLMPVSYWNVLGRALK